MKKQIAEIITERMNNGSHNRYQETAVVATIVEETGGNFEVEVKPDPRNNNGNSFYHTEVMTDLSRGLGVHAYLKIEDNVIIGRFF